jgi:hypothetical protein
MKRYTKVIRMCMECPNCELDEGWGRYVCRAKDEKVIMIALPGPNEKQKGDVTKIPDWCPLPDYEGSYVSHLSSGNEDNW